MRVLLFTLMSALGSVAVAATVYKWVDENGVTHYSDQPHENAQKVQLKAPQTYSAPPVAPVKPQGAAGSRGPAQKKGPVYQSCTVIEPTTDQVYLNTSDVSASVMVVPVMRAGDRAVVTLDGAQVPGVPVAGGQFMISPVDRGSHTLQFTVQD